MSVAKIAPTELLAWYTERLRMYIYAPGPFVAKRLINYIGGTL